MEIIKQWALMLCAMCILYCILEGILPQKEPFPVIKTACVLYILIALLSPAKFKIIKDISFDIPQFEYEQDGYENYEESTIKNAEILLNKRLETALTQAGYTNLKTDVTLLKNETGQISVDEVIVKITQDTDSIAVTDFINSFFESEVNIRLEVLENAG